MSTDREFFIKCLTEGIPVYGAKMVLRIIL